MDTNHRKKVISRRNAGLGDNLFATAHAWYYAKSTNRSLVINWAPSMYLSDQGANAFPFFFEVPQEIEGVPIIVEPRVSGYKRFTRRLPLIPYRYFIPVLAGETVHKFLRKKTPSFLMTIMNNRRKWSIDLIKNGTDVRYKTMIFNSHYGFLLQETKPFFDALKLKPEFQSAVDHFSEKNFNGKKVIGVHIKYYDSTMPKSNHTQHWIDPQESLNKIKDRIQTIVDRFNGSDHVIYVATDRKLVVDFLKEKFSNIICYDKEYKIEFTQSQHLKLNDEAASAALIEMFLLAKSEVLYRYPPSGSWFSHYGSLYARETIM
jgi:hypothetical protein